LLSEVGLNIREAHVFSTTDGFCLDVFVVDGWETEVNACSLTYLWSMFLFGFLKLTVECSPFYGEKIFNHTSNFQTANNTNHV
jgi:hypothetical protein